MIIDMSQALTTFFDESRELLTEMESILLSAEQETFDSEQMNALFRCAHTIKGSAGMFGLNAVVRFTHEVETLLDRLRHGDIALSSELVSLLLETRDHMAHLLDAVSGGAAVDSETEHGLISRMQVWGGKASGPAGPVSVVTAAASGPSLVPAQNSADSSATGSSRSSSMTGISSSAQPSRRARTRSC